MIIVEKGADFEFYSSTSKGAVQGNGYTFHARNVPHSTSFCFVKLIFFRGYIRTSYSQTCWNKRLLSP